MKSVQTHLLQPNTLSHHDSLQVYNGLDCALTFEIFEELTSSNHSKISVAAQVAYDFERAMQAPALEMMLRGWKVDLFLRDVRVAELRANRDKVQEILDELVCVIWDGGKSPLGGKNSRIPGLNPASPKQMKEFFYGRLRCPEQYAYAKGEKKVSTNRDALEKLEDYFQAKIFVRLVLKIRELNKKISVLTTEVDKDGRIRTSYNVASTETMRWSSSKSSEGTGANLQNITEELRDILIADPGQKFAYIDKSQAESRALGFIIWHLFGDPTYLDACESGDLHTMVARGIWPELAWTGDPNKDKEVAEQKFYLHFSYRDLAKRGGHATNYYGQPFTVAKHLKVKADLIKNFQEGYFRAFPGIAEYHRYIAREIGKNQYLEVPVIGNGRHFFGRPNDDSTLREGIAWMPQSMVANLLNLALWRVWKYEKEADVLAQIHDAIVAQYPQEIEDAIIPKLVRRMPTPLTSRGRTVIIPSDVLTGWNFRKWGDGSLKNGKKTPMNPDGLKGYKGHDDRVRKFDPLASGLDRTFP